MNGKMKTICALMTGMTVGTVAGVLYAPQIGSRTRRDLRRRADRKLDEIGDMKGIVRDYTLELMSGIKDNTNARIARTRRTIAETDDAHTEQWTASTESSRTTCSASSDVFGTSGNDLRISAMTEDAKS